MWKCKLLQLHMLSRRKGNQVSNISIWWFYEKLGMVDCPTPLFIFEEACIFLCNYISWNLIISYTFFQNKRNPGVPKPRLFTVGRLDVATTGLIIVTNDGIYISGVCNGWILCLLSLLWWRNPCIFICLYAVTGEFAHKLSHPSSNLSKE